MLIFDQKMTTLVLVLISIFLNGLLFEKGVPMYCFFNKQMFLTSKNHQRKNLTVNLQIILVKSMEMFQSFHQIEFCNQKFSVVFSHK